MEHLITDKEFNETLAYYVTKFRHLGEVHKASPAEACVVLLCGIIDTALRVVFSEEDERLSDLEERVSELEGDSDGEIEGDPDGEIGSK